MTGSGHCPKCSKSISLPDDPAYPLERFRCPHCKKHPFISKWEVRAKREAWWQQYGEPVLCTLIGIAGFGVVLVLMRFFWMRMVVILGVFAWCLRWMFGPKH